MLTFSSFNRATLKLFVAAFFVLGGAWVTTARAQNYVVDSSNDSVAHGWPSSTGTGLANGVAPVQAAPWADVFGVLTNPEALVDRTFTYPVKEDQPTCHPAPPSTTPSITYSMAHRKVEVSGIVMFEGKPQPHVKVHVFVELAGDFTNWQQLATDKNGAYRVMIQAPARITGVTVHPTLFCSDDVGCDDIAVSGFARSITGQPDAMSPCTRPNVAPAPGLGLGGVAISNSTPAAENTEHVDATVDAYNLF